MGEEGVYLPSGIQPCQWDLGRVDGRVVDLERLIRLAHGMTGLFRRPIAARNAAQQIQPHQYACQKHGYHG
jgi:hypothetical protein